MVDWTEHVRAAEATPDEVEMLVRQVEKTLPYAAPYVIARAVNDLTHRAVSIAKVMWVLDHRAEISPVDGAPVITGPLSNVEIDPTFIEKMKGLAYGQFRTSTGEDPTSFAHFAHRIPILEEPKPQPAGKKYRDAQMLNLDRKRAIMLDEE